jgi:hypothetical protein
MTSTARFQAAATDVPSVTPDAQFDYERFDVYQVALEFQELVPRLFPRRGYAALRDQLDRASASILLNIAEGTGRFGRADKAHFYLIARGSAMESAAILASSACSADPRTLGDARSAGRRLPCMPCTGGR